jgi:hypothetical protein
MSTTQVVGACCDDPVVIAGSSSAKVTQVTITTAAPQVLVASSLADRDGIAIRNHEDAGSGNDIYIGFSVLEATAAAGWPIIVQGGITLNIGAGVTVYAQAVQNTADIRIIETGN